MNTFRRPLIATFALVLSVSSLLAEEAITLKQEWQPGKRYFQSMKMEQSMKLNFGGTAMDQKTALSTDTTMSVTQHEDGKRRRIGLKYARMLMEADVNGQKMVFDSSKPADPASPMGNPFAAIADKEIRALADETGKVVDIENPEVFGALGANPMASAAFSKEALIQGINQNGLQSLPGKPVKSGDSWPFLVEVAMPGMGKLAIKGTYTFKGVSPHAGVPCAQIAVDGSIQMGAAPAAASASANPMAQLGMKIEEGTMKGTVWFDTALNAARGSDLTQVMTMSMKSPANPAETMKIPINQHVTTELTKVEAIK